MLTVPSKYVRIHGVPNFVVKVSYEVLAAFTNFIFTSFYFSRCNINTPSVINYRVIVILNKCSLMFLQSIYMDIFSFLKCKVKWIPACIWQSNSTTFQLGKFLFDFSTPLFALKIKFISFVSILVMLLTLFLTHRCHKSLKITYLFGLSKLHPWRLN
jgi:hypothetical protein